MSVFTSVAFGDLEIFLKNYSIGRLLSLEGIASGIENTNYFVATTHGLYVLTLFEKLSRQDLPFFLDLMAHLSRHGIPCPQPIANLENTFLGELNGKPASLVSRLEGASVTDVTEAHCSLVGEMLADMHLAGKSFKGMMPNPRGWDWRKTTAQQIAPHLDTASAEMLNEELRYQALHRFEDLPRGVIHGDLFRDNVLFVNAQQLAGAIDFYYACNDAWLYDLAITVNDWCVTSSGELDRKRMAAMLNAYHKLRPLLAIERGAWPVMLRAAALRFWLSRAYDLYFPRSGELTHAKDPAHFQRVLRSHQAQSLALQNDWAH